MFLVFIAMHAAQAFDLCPRAFPVTSIMHLALLDSTGWGLLTSSEDPAKAVRVGQCIYMVSPGASLHDAGVVAGQLSLVQAVAEEENGLLEGFFCIDSSSEGDRH